MAFFSINNNNDMLLSVTGKLPPGRLPPKIFPLGQDQRVFQGQGWGQSSGGQSSRGQFSQCCRYLSSDKKYFLADQIVHKQILFQHYHDGIIVCQCFYRVSFLYQIRKEKNMDKQAFFQNITDLFIQKKIHCRHFEQIYLFFTMK